jgi:hypothetical protein
MVILLSVASRKEGRHDNGGPRCDATVLVLVLVLAVSASAPTLDKPTRVQASVTADAGPRECNALVDITCPTSLIAES